MQRTISDIQVFQTAEFNEDRLAKLDPAKFEPIGDTVTTVEIDPEKTYQQIVGFGAAFTESAAHALSQLSAANREKVIKAYFGGDDSSQYTLCRTHINSCDFSLGNYAYNEVSGDYDLKTFDISRDQQLLIPLIKDALKMSGARFKLFASPWSPPAWMKTTGEMNHGGRLKRDCLATWALFFSKYIQAYKDEGIDIWGVTVQNEPDAKQTWDSCIYSADEERDFVKYYLGPRLAADGLDNVKIMIWDHNKDDIFERADGVLSDPDAAKYIWGVGYHWYAGDHFKNMDKVHQHYPEKRLIATEACQENGVKLGSWALGERYGHAIIGDMNHWSVGWVDWNMVLDEKGGPNHVGNYCDAPIIADTENDTVHFQNAYYYLGHFSRFVKPDAYRIGVKSSEKRLEVTAFKNPDQGIVVVAMNPTDAEFTFDLKDGDMAARMTIPAHAMRTLTYKAG